MKHVKLFEGFLNENTSLNAAIDAFDKKYSAEFPEIVAVGGNNAQSSNNKIFQKANIAVYVTSKEKISEMPHKFMGFDVLYLEESMNEKIKKEGDEYVVYPKKGGKRLGTHKTKKGALKQLAAIEISKAKRS
jgi:hypothetical protein